MNITLSPIDDHFFRNVRLNLTAFIHLRSPLEPPFTTFTHSWTRSGASLNSSRQLVISNNTVELGPLLLQTSLVIMALDGEGADDGEYTCTVHIVSSNDLVMRASASSTRAIYVEG